MASSGGVLARACGLFCISIGLSGCVAAAIPIAAAEMGMVGFEGYKLVQTSTGGSVGVHFRMEGDKELPPEPLPAVKRVAVWPGDEGDTMFADTLEKSGRFLVTPPGKVSSILARASIGTNAKMLTDHEMNEGYAAICRATGTELIFASRAGTVKSNVNSFSFSRPTQTYTANLMTYSCQKHAVIWRDELSLVVGISDSNIPSGEELNRIASDAWAKRIDDAMKQSVATN